MYDWDSLNAEVIAEFRANAGVVDRFAGLPVVILHTVGAKSGRPREVPLIPVFERDAMMVYGTAAGSPTDPAWCHNLRAHPRVSVDYETETFTADLVELPDGEAMALVGARAEHTPQLAAYIADAAPRSIPVFRIDRA